MSTSPFDTRRHRSRLRISLMLVIGLVVAVPVGIFWSWDYAPALGWAAAALTFLVMVWSVIGRLDADGTAAHATREDPGRTVSDVLVLSATVASFGGVVLILLDAGSAQGPTKAAIIGVALASVALSWVLVNTLFMLRYASLYYRGRAGVDFNEDSPPHYRDFAYLSFTVGMTFQVSDTNLKTNEVRSTVLRQALLAYVFGAIVLATSINLVSGLVH
ncbi:DUF1345 domain-containing protein [Paeniglutamicibacter cryotolerans]|uniref:Putative membrane protein n=1 Tax=Paeniglutamicibacter cryotolerans TaxID=670079 RepID=A0A839QN12_9MICC|nr:DUF1345 domain-containing protein [Paeniglutamicibacter cryotolerans]MBB2995386.1 putative membrane protein [Paeniglutamicibacter cryotolerans]